MLHPAFPTASNPVIYTQIQHKLALIPSLTQIPHPAQALIFFSLRALKLSASIVILRAHQGFLNRLG